MTATPHEVAVRARMDDMIRELGASCLGERLHRAHVAHELPAFERLLALAWELGICDVEPDVEVVASMRAEGLITRSLTYDEAIEGEDASDPCWWLAAAEDCGEIPRGLRAMWRTELDRAKQPREAGRDSEAE